MTESAKTLIFVAVGIVSLLVGFVVGPTKDNFNVESLVGGKLNEFDIDEPKRLKIVRFDSDTAGLREFEVAEENGLWVIPSKQNYPADATRQMAEAATTVMDLEILRIAATSASQHESLGVIDPTSAGVETQSDGVGIRVTMQDNNKKDLTDMIIGKEDKDAEGQYFVRNANQDVVYVVDLEPEKLSTRFEDWIEDDLLKLNTFDISEVQVKDYSAELQFTLSGIRVNYDRRAEMVLDYDNSKSKWSAKSLRKFDPATKSYTEVALADDEQLNEDALTDLKNGLDDLKIVDVERKPAGLSADLKAGDDFLKDNSAATSLIARGFAPVPMGPNSEAEILSSEGEVICSLDTGVEYVLRFGNLQLEGDGEEASAEDSPADPKGEGINRYLFVMARFNKELIEQPEIDDLPELPAGMTEADAEATTTDEGKELAEKEGGEEAAGAEETPSDTSAADAAAEDEDAPVEEEEEEEEEAPADGTEVAAEDASETEQSDAEEPADTSDETNAATEETVADASSTSEESAAEAPAEEQEDDLAKIIEERKRIEKENQRKLDEYQKQIEDGKKKVDELNERFGDWYYVISNEVYQQIHLDLDKLIEKKEKPAEEEKNEADPAAVPGLPNLNFQNPLE